MIMDASINVAMEPFRALVADNLPDNQRTLGFSFQTFLYGIGAVAGSWLPYVLANYFGVSDSLGGWWQQCDLQFLSPGAIVFFGAIMVTILFAKSIRLPYEIPF